LALMLAEIRSRIRQRRKHPRYTLNLTSSNPLTDEKKRDLKQMY